MQAFLTIDKILKDESLDIRVTELLLRLGIHASLGGYRYLRAAVMLTGGSPTLAEYPTKTLYPIIAKYFGTTPSIVERSCRRAIERAYFMGQGCSMGEFFSERGIIGKPTCKEFILTVADFVREEY